MSRWYICCEPTIYHRCRNCGVKFRLTLAGNLVFVAFLVSALLPYALVRLHVLAPIAALVLLLIMLVVMVWLAPYVSPVKAKQVDKTKEDENTTT
jgi:hypothetical protein